MPSLVAFASLPFGLKEAAYPVRVGDELVTVHVSELRYNPFVAVATRRDLLRAIPPRGLGEGYVSYTWYDHPFVLRVVFSQRVAALGSINSCATVVQPLDPALDIDDEAALSGLREAFTQQALEALNTLIATVRRRARVYQVFDLRRDDIQLSIRDDRGAILRGDPLESSLEQADDDISERLDLLDQPDAWYDDLAQALRTSEQGSLADDLVMEAERALAQRFPRQAIATCYTAIETGASSLLTRAMARRGIDDEAIDETLSSKSLPSMLDAMLRTYAGYSLRAHNRALWRDVVALGDLRNDVVHRGRRPTREDAAFAIQAARDVLNWLNMVRSRLSS